MKQRYELIEDGNGKFKIIDIKISPDFMDDYIHERSVLSTYDDEQEARTQFDLLVAFKQDDEKIVRIIKEVEYDV